MPTHRRPGPESDHPPAHPTGRAILLMIGVVVLILLLAAAPLIT